MFHTLSKEFPFYIKDKSQRIESWDLFKSFPLQTSGSGISRTTISLSHRYPYLKYPMSRYPMPIGYFYGLIAPFAASMKSLLQQFCK
jgi:hypothetical protein